MVMLVRVRDSKSVGDDLQKGHFGQVDVLPAIPVGDVKDCFIETGRHSLGDLECPFVRRLAACYLLTCVPKLDAHSLGHDTARYVHYMDRHSGHQFSLAPESLTG
jgi:hypothetical protein